MSNITPQIALNNGYTVIATDTVAADPNGTQILAVADTNRILVAGPCDNSSRQAFIGKSGSDTGHTFPLSQISGYVVGGIFTNFYLPVQITIDTATPEDFYIYGSGDCRVMYLKLNTP